METEVVFEEFFEYVNSDYSSWQESEKGVNYTLWKRNFIPSTTLCMRMEAFFPGIPPDIAFTCVADTEVRK